MKTSLSLLLLSVATTGVYSSESLARPSLRSAASIAVFGASNLHQCYNHCERHTSKSEQWIENCKQDCDDEYGQPQCYNLGQDCEEDDDCLQGGFNPCNKCGDEHGTEYYKRCYGETPTPTPSPVEPIQCFNLGDPCQTDDDCLTGGFNPCTRCGTQHGTQYYGRCYSPGDDEDENFSVETPTGEELNANLRQAANILVQGPNNLHQCYNHCDRHTSKSEQWIENCKQNCDDEFGPTQCYNLGQDCEEDEDCLQGGTNMCTKCGKYRGTEYYKRCYNEEDERTLELIDDEDEDEDDGSTWDNAKKDTKHAAEKTAEGAKEASEKTAEWGKETFDPSSGYVKSGALLAAAGSFVAQAFLA